MSQLWPLFWLRVGQLVSNPVLSTNQGSKTFNFNVFWQDRGLNHQSPSCQANTQPLHFMAMVKHDKNVFKLTYLSHSIHYSCCMYSIYTLNIKLAVVVSPSFMVHHMYIVSICNSPHHAHVTSFYMKTSQVHSHKYSWLGRLPIG